jgi:hypothetical protein
MGFKDKVKQINSKFYFKEFDGPKEEKKTSTGLLYYGETHHLQVWDIDNRGEHYMVMDIVDRAPGRGDYEWLKEADRMRREGSQVKNLKKHNERAQRNAEIDAKINRHNNEEMAKDFRPYLLKEMEKVGL